MGKILCRENIKGIIFAIKALKRNLQQLLESQVTNPRRNARIGRERRLERGFREKSKLVHNYYLRTGRYRFLGQSALKLGLSVLALGVLVAVFNHFVVDPQAILAPIFDNFPLWIVYVVFFLSESVMGFLPPDAFIIWTGIMPHTIPMVILLAILSYAGGHVSFWIGRWLQRSPWVREKVERRFKEQFITFRKFGRMLVLISSMTPLPFSPISIVAGTSGMSWWDYTWTAAFRFVRFAAYAYFLLGAIK